MAETMGDKLSATAEITPATNSTKNVNAEKAASTILTPPNTTVAAASVVENKSISQEGDAGSDQLPASPSQVTQPELGDDPFVESQIHPDQAAAKPAGVALNHISAIIEANISHPRVGALEPPREDRLNQAVTVHNAQGLFPKEAKLFVANLSNLCTNDQLEISVAAAFEQFGACTIIIKRDRNHQPMAFVQYQLVQHAEDAMANANGCVIDGRIVRIEWASARQELIVSKYSNELLSEREVRQAFIGRGPIASIKRTGPEASEGDLSTAWLVSFRYYADCKEAGRIMRESPTFRVVPAPKTPRQTPYPIAPPRTPRGELYQDTDSTSIYVGNLPDSITEEELKEHFAYLGSIEDCIVISKPMTTGGMNTFGFIEFMYAEDAASAANTEQHLRGVKLRVERKQYSQRRAARISAASAPFSPAAMPRPQYFNPYTQGPTQSPYHPVTPYPGGHPGFTPSDYNTTPPTPVCMGQWSQYTPPVSNVNQFPYPQAGHQMSPVPYPRYYGSQRSVPYYQSAYDVGQMHVIPEEHDGSVFD